MQQRTVPYCIMCCRYYYEDFERELRELMRLEKVVKLSDFSCADNSRRDISPSQSAVIIHGASPKTGPEFDPETGQQYNVIGASEMVWGFSNPVKKGLIINARAETARDKVTFADSIARRRCVIPASGFYEWDAHKAKFRFTSQDGGLLLLAGFYREEQGVPRYTVLTTAANDSMIKVHDRMPVMIGRDEIRPWIEEDAKLPYFLGREQDQLVCEQESGQISFLFDTET